MAGEILFRTHASKIQRCLVVSHPKGWLNPKLLFFRDQSGTILLRKAWKLTEADIYGRSSIGTVSLTFSIAYWAYTSINGGINWDSNRGSPEQQLTLSSAVSCHHRKSFDISYFQKSEQLCINTRPYLWPLVKIKIAKTSFKKSDKSWFGFDLNKIIKKRLTWIVKILEPRKDLKL